MKHSPTGISASPPAPEMLLLHLISFGFILQSIEEMFRHDMMDVPVSYKASTSTLCTLTLYKITLSKFTLSIVTS